MILQTLFPNSIRSEVVCNLPADHRNVPAISSRRAVIRVQRRARKELLQVPQQYFFINIMIFKKNLNRFRPFFCLTPVLTPVPTPGFVQNIQMEFHEKEQNFQRFMTLRILKDWAKQSAA